MTDSNRKGFAYPVLLIIVVIILAAYIINDKKDVIANFFTQSQQNGQNQTPIATNPQPTPPPASPPSPPPGQFQISPQTIGSTFVVNGLQFKVLSAKNLGVNLSAIGSAYQTTSGSYVEAKLSATNIGTTNATLDNVLFAFQDSKGREYTTSFGSFMYVNVPNYQLIGSFNNSYGMSVIKPGFSVNYIFITDVAKDSTGIKLIVANQKDQNYFVPLGF